MPSAGPRTSSDPDLKPRPREPLAVIGIGCRFPGGLNSPAELWDALLRGVDAIRDVPEDRWIHSRFHDTNPEKTGSIRNAKGGFIDGVDQFDAEFFGYFPTEAQRLDPQQRLLLEVTHEAMEDAGLRRDQLDGSRTSVFVGSFMYDFLCIQAASEQRDEINPYVAMGTAVSSLSNRISYDFNLKGPSISLDTACSSSLVAVHLACMSLWNREAGLAIAGGVNVMLRPESSIILSKAGFLNPDQYCKAFDASANGYVRGEGVGVVIIKPLSRALADGDSIYAIVRGSGVNQDGYMPEGFTVPNVLSQIALLESVYPEAGVDPLTVDYVEAHGTGTSVGDPIESLALGAVLGRERRDGTRCLIGSVKTNLGHLEGAAGIAGFIKGVLTAKHGVAAPNLHFNNPNPEIDFENNKLEIPTKPTPLERDGHPFTIGVNSFGAGGTNAHIVLQEPPGIISRDRSHQVEVDSTVYLLSVSHRDALRTAAIRHADFLSTTSEQLTDLAFSAFSRRSHYEHVLAVVGGTPTELAAKLRQFADGKTDRETLLAKIPHKRQPKIGFVFSGQGGQWARMGHRLMLLEPIFRQTIEIIDSLFFKLAGWSLIIELHKDERESKVEDTIVVQPTVMAIQIALVKLYEHYGIRPDGVVGHSIGEVAAAFAAGALSLEEAAQVIFHRSQAQSRASGKGGMLAVGLSLEESNKLIDGYHGRVSIAAINGPKMLTLSGDTEPLHLISQQLDTRGVFNRPVRVQVAYHSHHMESIQGIMLNALHHLRGNAAATPLYSTVTGKREPGTHLSADYWFKNARQPVLFTDAMSAMLNDGYDTFIEIGPHPVLVGGAESLFQLRGTDAIIAPSMTRREPERVVFLHSLARLATRGAEPNTSVLFGTKRRFVHLPIYPWQHSRFWFEAPAATELRRGRFEHPFLKRQTELVTEEGLAIWVAGLDVQKCPYLRDHQVDGEVVFPATGHLELAWAVANEQFRYGEFFLENLHFDSPLILPVNPRHPLDVRLELVSGEGDYHICSRSADANRDSAWSKHSIGRMNTTHDHFAKSRCSLQEIQGRFHDRDTMSPDAFYETVRKAGLNYGEKFRCIKDMWHRDHEVLCRLELNEASIRETSRYFIHPALLDACLHAIFADSHRHGDPNRIFLPYSIERVRFYGRTTRMVWAYLRVTRNDEQFLCSDTLIFDDAGQIIAEVHGLICKRLAGAGSQQADSVYDGCFEYQWTATARTAASHGRNFDCTSTVLISDPSQFATDLTERLNRDGIKTLMISPRSVDSYDALLSNVSLDRRTLIVFAASLPSSYSVATVAADWRGLSNHPYVESLLNLSQFIHKREGVPRLCVITNGAGGVPGDFRLDLGQAILHGMARVINNECANVPLQVIDLGTSVSQQEVDELYREILHIRRDRDESEIAIRGANRFVRQLIPVDRNSAEEAASSEESGVGGNYRADLSDPGMLDQIVFRRKSLTRGAALRSRDVAIAVQAAALNFKDIMNGMGLLPKVAVAGGLTGSRLGLEVAGRVVRTGDMVHQFQVGDDVIARVSEGFCGTIVTPDHCVARRPEHLTPQQAAAIPVVFITAWYSLHHLARMASGETVLIHSAAGGVGGAAIQLAHRAGAIVIATAGTKDKRESLRKMGVAHVFDSRSLEFYNRMMEVTGGRGVDIVLNSLTGRFIAQSLKCLAPFGRFVEIGKLDIYRNSKINLKTLGENISYYVVDVDRLAAQRAELHRRMLMDVVGLFDRNEAQPHEITEYPISKISDAMKFMTRAAYSGKIVLNMQDERVKALPALHAEFHADCCYLITAGASGFGLEIARWMVSRGARHLILLSRSGCKSPEDQFVVDAMIGQGVEIVLANQDIADIVSLKNLMERIASELPPLAGVIHGAAVMDDALLSNMDMDRFEKVFNPKAQGAWNLHKTTVEIGAKLDFFLMLSSISSVLGFYGQVNYVAANFFQDSLATFRRQQGLPASSINLGVMGQYAGLSRTVNEEQDVIGLLESHGMLVMSLSDVLAKLEAVLLQQPVQRMTGRFDWSRFRTAYPHLARDARFVDILSDSALARGPRQDRSSLRAVLNELEPGPRHDRLRQELTATLARTLDITTEQLDPFASIDNLGLDSLMLTQMRNWILRALDINLPLIKLLKGPSLETLAAELLIQLNSSTADVKATKDADPQSSTFALAEMEGIDILSPWLIRGRGRIDAPIRLICFHSMGVGASLFTNFLLNPPNDYDILAIQTPGRENRMAEPVAESVDQLADLIVPQLLPLFDRPVVIWGHSFGGILAREVIRRLRNHQVSGPIHFLASGTIAPSLIHLWQKREIMLKAMVAENSPEYLVSLSRYVDDPEFLKAILPLMRRDYPLLKGYRYQGNAPLDCPITAFAARQDDMVYTDEIREWSRETNNSFELIEVDGDHWFLNRNRKLLTATLDGIYSAHLYVAANHIDRSASAISGNEL